MSDERPGVTSLARSRVWREAPSVSTITALRWTTASLYLVGGIVLLVALGVGLGAGPGAGRVDERGIGTLTAVAVAVGLLVASLGRRLHRWAYHALALGGTALITTLVLLAHGGVASLALSVPFLFVVINAVMLFAMRAALVHVTLAEVACAVSLASVGIPAGEIVIVLGCTIGLAGVVAWLTRAAGAADVDPLTGLASRRAFDRRLDEALRDAEREGGSVALAVLDVDRFKHVNDTAGHPAGDQLLVTCADAWSERMPATAVLSRYGGDEFTLLLPDTSLARAAELADELRGSVPETVTLSAGVAAWSPGDSGSVLINRADVALYEAKTGGRDRTVVYGDPQRAAGELESAIEAGQLALAYQPIVRLADGEVIGFEALCRWRHPRKGLLMPDQFIPQAERTGAIREVGAWILSRVCREVMGQGGPRRSVGVNASASELCHPGYAAAVRSVLDEWSMPGELLVLEVTEGAFDHEQDRVLANLAALRERGVLIAMDDFGSGYSSLRRLEQLPIDIIKLDGALVGAIREDSDDAPILEAIVSMGRSLGVRLVAEKVETTHQAEVLHRLGYDLGQGFHFGLPIIGELPR